MPFAISIPLGGFNRSGGVKTLVLLANAMASRGWQVRMIAPDYSGDPPFTLSPAVELVRLATGSFPAGTRKLIYYAQLATRAAVGADVCLASFYLTAYCAVLSRARNPRARVVYFVQGDEAVSHGMLAEASPLSRFIRAVLARWSYRLPVSTICVSHWLSARIGRPDAAIVAQGLDLEIFRPIRGSRVAITPVVIGSVGSTARGKGYADFCRAVALLPDRADVEVLVAAHEQVPLPSGVRGRIVAARTESEMAEFYNSCDIFVFTSLSEGFGLPPLEAMACGCAVVTTECGGITEFAEPGVNCLAVPPGDAVALSQAIWKLREDIPLRGRLAEQAEKTAQAFDRAQMIGRFLELVTP